MKNSEPRAMKEIHEIREKIHEKTKSMTFSERTKNANDSMMRMVKKYGAISERSPS